MTFMRHVFSALRLCTGLVGCCWSTLAFAQSAPVVEPSSQSFSVFIEPDDSDEPAPATDQSLDSSADAIGRRQSGRERVANIEPLGRLRTRIETRVPSRLNTRIDRGEIAMIDNTTALEYAQEQNRRTLPPNPGADADDAYTETPW